MTFFVFAQGQSEEKKPLEPATSVERTVIISISEGMSLVLYPENLQKSMLVYETSSLRRQIHVEEEGRVLVLSETRVTKKTSTETVLKARKDPSTAVVTLSKRMIYSKDQQRLSVDPLVVTEAVKLKIIHGQFLSSVMARIAEAVREQYSQNPEKKTLVLSDLKLGTELKEDIQVLLTTSVRSFYSRETKKSSKKAPVNLEDPEKKAKAEAKRLAMEQKAQARAEKKAKTFAKLVAEIEALKMRTQEKCTVNAERLAKQGVTDASAFQREAFTQLEASNWEAFKAANESKLAVIFNKTAFKMLDRYAKALKAIEELEEEAVRPKDGSVPAQSKPEEVKSPEVKPDETSPQQPK